MNTHDDFREVISLERENLTRLSDFWSAQIKCDTTLSKDAQGRIRAAVGKTRLLLAEKFKQFEGLIEQSANKTSEKEISINDLQGFWDLVLIQVNEVKEMFRGLGSLSSMPSSDGRKAAKSKSPESDFQKDWTKSGNILKKKSASDHLAQAEKKISEINEKEKGRSDGEGAKFLDMISKSEREAYVKGKDMPGIFENCGRQP